jgi:hypothetical protein
VGMAGWSIIARAMHRTHLLQQLFMGKASSHHFGGRINRGGMFCQMEGRGMAKLILDDGKRSFQSSFVDSSK